MSDVIEFPVKENVTEILECDCESLLWVFLIGEGLVCPHCQMTISLDELVDMH